MFNLNWMMKNYTMWKTILSEDDQMSTWISKDILKLIYKTINYKSFIFLLLKYNNVPILYIIYKLLKFYIINYYY